MEKIAKLGFVSQPGAVDADDSQRLVDPTLLGVHQHGECETDADRTH
jgi:hypothetical protein